MGLTLILGNSMKSNRDVLTERLLKESMNGQSKLFFFVPEQATLEAQKELSGKHPNHCVMNIDILSFRRLTHRLMDELGDRIPEVLDDIGKSMLLKRVLTEHRNELRLYGNKVNKPGFIEEMKSLISEFARCEVSAEQLSDISGKADDLLLADKLSEMSRIYGWFREACGNSRITEETIYSAMCPLVRESESLTDSTLYFDGYTGFTPTQYALLKELMSVCRDVVISIKMDPDMYENESKTGCFRISTETVQRFRELAMLTGHTVNPPIFVTQQEKNQDDAIRYLSESLFRAGSRVYKGDSADAIELYCGTTVHEEVRRVVGRISDLVRNRNAQYHDIGILCGNVQEYTEELRAALTQAKIPFFVDYKSDVLQNCLVDYIRSLIMTVESDMKTDWVMRFLRNRLNGFDEPTLNYLENYLLARGVRGKGRWKKGLTGDYDGKRMIASEAVEQFGQSVLEMLEPVWSCLADGKTTVAQKTEAIYGFLYEREVFRHLTELSEELKEEPVPWNLRRVKEHEAIYKAIMDLLNTVHSLLGDQPISAMEYLNLLDAGFAELKVGTIPPETDCILIGDMKRSRLAGVRHLFFLGMNDGAVPARNHCNELLNVREREILKEEYRIALSETEKEALDTDEFYLLMALEKPTESLTLSWKKRSEDGKETAESYVIRRIQRLFPMLTIHTDRSDRKTFFETIAIDGGREDLLEQYRQLSDPNGKKELLALYRWFTEETDGASETFDKTVLKNGENGIVRDFSMSAELAQELCGKGEIYSTSRLQTYANCPFYHFMQYTLATEPRKTYEPTTLDVGNVYHEVLDYIGKTMVEKEQNGESVTEESVNEIIRDGMERIRENKRYETFMDTARNRYRLQKLEEDLRFFAPILLEQYHSGDYHVKGTECRFEQEIDGNRFVGKVDRIDVCETEDGTLMKVIDYKSGNHEWKPEDVLSGRDIQLPAYLAILRREANQNGISSVPAAMLFNTITDSIKKNDKTTSEADLTELMKPNGLLVCENGGTIEIPDDNPDSITNTSPDDDGKDETELPHVTDKYLGHLDHAFNSINAGYKSAVLDAGTDKNGTIICKSATSEESMNALLDYTEELIQTEIRDIVHGDIAAIPYQDGKKTGCEYCNFAGVCRKDSRTRLKTRNILGFGEAEQEDE